MEYRFNNTQALAIEHKEGPMLVIAGPGSGKTAVLVQRAKKMVTEHGVNPSNILVITFTKAAANEMKQRFEKEMEFEHTRSATAGRVSFGTFHSVFFMVLKLAYHYESSNIVTEDVKFQMMRELIHKHNLDYRDENELIGGLLGEISQIKNARIPLEHYYSSQCSESVFRDIYKEYENYLRKNRLIDFDDMLTLTYELFQQRPDILSAWQKKYQYILVDEFQDINQIQYDIVKMLAAPENNLFMVGDDDQSIYRFRGSKPEIMLHVPKDYPNLKQVQLDVNYRCHPDIILASLKLIRNNQERFPKRIISKYDIENENVIDHLTMEPALQVYQFERQVDEITYILKQIEELTKKGVALSDIAILFRTNTQPRFLMEQLMAYNISFKTREQIPNLYDHWIAKDLKAYMDIARGSRERKDFLMILNKPKRYIGRDSLCESQVAFDEWEKMYDEQPWIAERIEKLHYDIKMLAKMSPYAAINYIRKGIGYDDYIEEYAQYRNINKDDLYDILEELQASAKGFKNYDAWELHIEEYTKELKERIKNRNENPNAVTLSTMHSAKGLEFKIVFIVEANEGIMPYKKAVLDKDIEEERRLFYVGMTRAIECLYICSIKELHGNDIERSRFVEELLRET
ncbi:MAG: ATP-dependent helicase [Agathobacter sp.]|nr:ATP-dependent helicase [Agathobacter sp.]